MESLRSTSTSTRTLSTVPEVPAHVTTHSFLHSLSHKLQGCQGLLLLSALCKIAMCDSDVVFKFQVFQQREELHHLLLKTSTPNPNHSRVETSSLLHRNRIQQFSRPLLSGDLAPAREHSQESQSFGKRSYSCLHSLSHKLQGNEGLLLLSAVCKIAVCGSNIASKFQVFQQHIRSKSSTPNPDNS